MDLDLRFGVQRRCGFIQDEDGGVLQERPGNADTLALPAGKFHPLLADDRIVPQGEIPDKPVGKSGLRGLRNLFKGLAHFPVSDIVAHRLVEKDGLLGDDADHGPKGFHPVIADIHAVDQNLAIGYVVESGKQVDQSRFSPAAGPHEGHHFSCLNAQVDVLQDPVLLVFEGNIPVLHLPHDGREGSGPRLVLDLRDGVENLKDPAGGGQPLLHGIVDPAKPFYRFIKQ